MAKEIKLIKIHNVETGEVIEREMDAEELAQSIKDEQNDLIMRQAIAKREADRKLILEKLGLTEDEAAILLG